MDYRTVDRDESLDPDIVLNLESEFLNDAADAIIVNGVFEQCNDPWALLRSVWLSLKSGGKLLVGLPSIGMEPYGEKDKWRVTRAGAREYMKHYKVTGFWEFPTYFYITGEKK